MFEGLIKFIFKEVKNIDYTGSVERMSWEEAMWNYGNDKPDIRFGMKIANIKSPLKRKGAQEADGLIIGKAGFTVFDQAETVLAIAVPGAADWTRKQFDGCDRLGETSADRHAGLGLYPLSMKMEQLKAVSINFITKKD